MERLLGYLFSFKIKTANWTRTSAGCLYFLYYQMNLSEAFTNDSENKKGTTLHGNHLICDPHGGFPVRYQKNGLPLLLSFQAFQDDSLIQAVDVAGRLI